MPLYFFHLSFGDRTVPDDEGVELPNRPADLHRIWLSCRAGDRVSFDHAAAAAMELFRASAHFISGSIG